MPATRLYYGEGTSVTGPLEFDAMVTDIRLHSTDERGQLWQLALDRTAFYPEGGGQPCDDGTLTATAKSGAQLEVAVERTEEDEAGEVWHFVRKPLEEGTEVQGNVDAARRQDHEQQHSGQHLLSAVFLRELAAPTMSFHLGAEVVTIDVAVAELSEAQIRRVEEAANRAVTECRPLTQHWIEPEMAAQMMERGELRKVPPREGKLRIVQMQGIEFNACGGTHVASTGAIGAITIRKVEKVKKGLRVEFCCGQRAIRTARTDYLRLKETALTLSVAQADVPARVATLLKDVKSLAKELKAAGKPQT